MVMKRKIAEPIKRGELKELAKAVGGFYIKVVVDIKKGILAGGAKMHTDEERLLKGGDSSQEDLWGGEYDLETKQITFDSIINNKPEINASSEILNLEVRKKFADIVKRLLNI
jgi:hypothetical protein